MQLYRMVSWPVKNELRTVITCGTSCSRGAVLPHSVLLIVVLLSSNCVSPAAAQLRPLEPLDWDLFHSNNNVHASARFGWLNDQRASLAGTVGRLIEVGDVRAVFRTGRVLIEFAGTPQRWFRDDEVFAAPTGGALPPPADGKRHDAGDYRVAAAVLLGSSPARLSVLRFGTRLPTTDNRVGLDRDQTDFFALLGAQQQAGAWTFAGEAGVGIHGTRLAHYEQSDVLVYSVRIARRQSGVTPAVTLLGQEDLKSRAIRGNEDLGEVRFSIRSGSRRWVEVAAVAGYREFSPEAGVMLSGGWHFDWR
jgi:hypothetical protein